MAQNLLMFRRKDQIRALNVDTIFDGAIGCFFVFIRRGSQCDEEAKRLLLIQCIEVGNVLDIFLNKGEYIG
jgi:hypothetical protein